MHSDSHQREAVAIFITRRQALPFHNDNRLQAHNQLR
jgi:hypothetical protein